MEISLDSSNSQYKIQAYANGRIRINGNEYQQPLLVGLTTLETKRIPKTIEEIDRELFLTLELSSYEAVILGTGETLNFPDWQLLEQAQILGTPLEVMATDAACRTFTVLASEGRNVLALLYP